MKKTSLLLLAAMPVVLSGCALGAAAGVGATVGVAAAQERGIEGAISDTTIRATINDLWFKYDLETFAKLNLTINQGRVLITGVVQKPESRVEAVRLAWQAKGVKEVINEIKVANSGGITGYARDTWISTRLRTTLTFDRNILSINYSIDTVQGVVYLMGVARNQAELDRVIGLARTIPDVKQVVSYVKLAGEAGTTASSQGTNTFNNNAVDNTAPAGYGGNYMDAPNNPGGSGQPESYQSPPPDYQSNSAPAPLVPAPVESAPLNSGY
jgi:osmotically-inducible protein OsmY